MTQILQPPGTLTVRSQHSGFNESFTSAGAYSSWSFAIDSKQSGHPCCLAKAEDA